MQAQGTSGLPAEDGQVCQLRMVTVFGVARIWQRRTPFLSAMTTCLLLAQEDASSLGAIHKAKSAVLADMGASSRGDAAPHLLGNYA